MPVIIYKGVRYDTAQGLPWVSDGLHTIEEKAAVQPSPTKPQADLVAVGINITENGTYNAPEGKAYNPVSVSVPQPTLTELDVSANGTYVGKYNKVNVDVPNVIPQDYIDAYDKVQTIVENEKFTTNGTKNGIYENPQILVPTSSKIEITLSITEGGEYEKEPDEGYTYNKVKVNIPTANFKYYPATKTGVFENVDVEVI